MLIDSMTIPALSRSFGTGGCPPQASETLRLSHNDGPWKVHPKSIESLSRSPPLNPLLSEGSRCASCPSRDCEYGLHFTDPERVCVLQKCKFDRAGALQIRNLSIRTNVNEQHWCASLSREIWNGTIIRSYATLCF